MTPVPARGVRAKYVRIGSWVFVPDSDQFERVLAVYTGQLNTRIYTTRRTVYSAPEATHLAALRSADAIKWNNKQGE